MANLGIIEKGDAPPSDDPIRAGEYYFRKQTLARQKFIKLYCEDPDVFGNGTRSYMLAYGQPDRAHAQSAASQLLADPQVVAAVNWCLSISGYSDTNVERQHLFLINQHADLKVKMSAIKHYDELKGRMAVKKTETKHVHTVSLRNLYERAEKMAGATPEKIIEGEVIEIDDAERQRKIEALKSAKRALDEI